MEGHNASVFAYGQTGTGKTFTMGTNNTAASALNTSAGIIPRAIKQIFENDTASNIKVSFYEILSEQVIDETEPLIPGAYVIQNIMVFLGNDQWRNN